MTKTLMEIEITVDGLTETIMAEKLSGNFYYCLESPVFIELDLYGAEIETTDENIKPKFLKVHKQSTYSTHRYLWSKEFLASEKGESIKKEILAIGGNWEQIMGGLFFIYLPIEKNKSLKEILKVAE